MIRSQQDVFIIFSESDLQTKAFYSVLPENLRNCKGLSVSKQRFNACIESSSKGICVSAYADNCFILFSLRKADDK